MPQIDIQKTPDVQLTAPGSDVTFTITVTNAGVVPLIDVAVTDALAPACDTTIAALAVGENTSYDCTVTGVTADFTNTAAVTATDTAGNPASDSDTADVDVVTPAITIAKTPDLQSVGLNGTPTFTISVANTGDIDLTNVVVTDALAPACDATFATLPVGATETYSCDGTATAADFTNTAAATADSPVGPVSDSDTADVTVLLPGIDIQKTPDTQLVGPGGTATFTITVTNAGATPLSNITVGDPLAPACDATIAALAIGESTSYDCDVTGITGDFTNTASVTAEDPLGNPVVDSDTADVDFVDPAITVSKTPDLQTLLAGEDAAFTVTITNSGDTDLTNVVLSDPLAPGCDATFASLAIGASEIGRLLRHRRTCQLHQRCHGNCGHSDRHPGERQRRCAGRGGHAGCRDPEDARHPADPQRRRRHVHHHRHQYRRSGPGRPRRHRRPDSGVRHHHCRPGGWGEHVIRAAPQRVSPATSPTSHPSPAPTLSATRFLTPTTLRLT